MVDHEEHNKMGVHSVATILAPSLFPPRCIAHSKDDVLSQVQLAERCIVLTEKILRAGESIWIVPNSLMRQLRNRNEKENNKPVSCQKDFLGVLIGEFICLQSLFRQSKKDSVKNVDSIFVEATQFNLPQFRINISDTLTAGDVVLE